MYIYIYTVKSKYHTIVMVKSFTTKPATQMNKPIYYMLIVVPFVRACVLMPLVCAPCE